MKKKLTAVSAMLCAGVMAFSLASCNAGNNEAEAASFVSLDINPSIELTLDKHDKVLSVYGGNEDGQVLLYNEEELVGLDVETAVEKITSLAVRYGYLDEGNKVVETSVTSAKKGTENLLNKINAKVTATAGGLNVNVTCEGVDEAFSLARKLDQIKKQYPDNAAVQSLTAEKLKLVLSATEDGKISVEAAVELDTSELIQKVSETHKQVVEFATAAYRKVKATASAAYDIAVGDASDAIYTTYYAVKHPINSYYAFSYTGYKYSARALNATADALVYVEKACDYPLNGEQVTAAATALGITEDISVLENSDGDITVNSIYAYADKAFKNSQASAELENVKTQLNAALDDVEDALREKVTELSAKYETEIAAVKDKMDAVAEQIGNLAAMAPETVKTQIQTMANDCKEVAAEVTEIAKDGKITADEVRSLAGKLGKKAGETLARIEADMTKEELEEVKKLQEKAVNALTGAKAQMEKALSDAEEIATARLEELKAKRTAK